MQQLPPLQPYSPRERRYLSFGLAFVALVYLASFLYLSNLAAHNPQATPYPIVAADSTYYTGLADNLLVNHVYAPAGTLEPTRAAPPGYAFLLAVVKGATGSFTPVSVIQTALALLAIFLIYDIGRRYMSSWLAFLAAFAYALEPMVIFANTTILTDGLFSSLLVIIVYLGFFQKRVHGVVRASLVGLLLGALTLERPTGEYLIAVLPVLFVMIEWLRPKTARIDKRYTLMFIAYFVCVTLVVAPWIMRNHSIWGIYEIEHERTHDLLDYDVKDFLAWRELNKTQPTSVFYPARHPSDPVFVKVTHEINDRWETLTPPGDDPEKYTARLGIDFILEHPFSYTYFHLAHLPAFFLGSSIATYLQVVHQLRDNTGFSESTLYRAQAALIELLHRQHIQEALSILIPIGIEIAWWATVVALALVGWFFERRRGETWLFASLVGYFALITGPISIARYRIPVEPYLFLLTGFGVHALMQRVQQNRALMKYFARFAKVVRYIISGGSAFVASVVVYSFLLYVVGLWYITASILAFLLAFFISFVLQKFFTFRDPTPPKHGEQVRNYFLVLLVNIGANTAILYALVQWAGLGNFLSLVIANAVIAVWNYFIYAFIIFTGKIIESSPAQEAPREKIAEMSVIIPCHNEEESIGKVVDSVPNGVREIIVVDNNCTDRTAAVAREHGARVVSESRRGYGAAVKAGFAAATGSILAVVDGDNQHPSEELGRILGTLIDEKLDFISGSRFPLPPHAEMTLMRHVGNWGLTLAANIIFGVSLNDSQSGMVVFKREILKRVEPKGDDVVFVQEMKILAARDVGLGFAEYHIPCIPRVAGVSKVFPIRHGIRLLYALIALRIKGLPKHG